MKYKLVALGTLMLSVAPMAAQADTILGLYVGGQGWNADYDGGFGPTDSTLARQVDGDKTLTSFYAALEHPLPVVPNIKIRQNSMDIDSGVNGNDSFDNVDYTLYYEIFDNDIVAIDVGLNGKQFDGQLSTGATDAASYQFSGVIPTAYAAARIGLPMTSWTITGEAKAVSFDDSKLHDVQAGLEYRVIDNMAVDVSVTAGYRSMNVELDDVDGVYSDLRFKGPYLALDVHF